MLRKRDTEGTGRATQRNSFAQELREGNVAAGRDFLMLTVVVHQSSARFGDVKREGDALLVYLYFRSFPGEFLGLRRMALTCRARFTAPVATKTCAP